MRRCSALARHRTGVLGLPAVSIDLPAVLGAGFVFESGDTERERILKGLGADRLPLQRLYKLLESIIRDSPQRKADKSQVIVCLARYGIIEEGAVSKRDRRFATVRFGGTKSPSAAEDDETKPSAASTLTQALTRADATVNEASRSVADALVDKLAAVFNIPAADIDAGLPMSSYGVDSLVAVELKNWLWSAVKSKMSIFEILQTPSLEAFAPLAAGRSELLLKAAKHIYIQ